MPAAGNLAGGGHVAILGLGPTLEQYVDLTKRLGSRWKLCDEVWAINALGGVLSCDRVFHMDDVLVQEARAAANPNSNIAAMLGWMRRFKGEIITSVVDQDGRDRSAYQALKPFPLADVISSTGYAYFNSTAAYAMAYAVHVGVRKISLFGCDFSYKNSHDAEKGRACMEFWLALALERGIEIQVADRSSLMDMCEPESRKFYGYDAVDVRIEQDGDGPVRTIMAARPLPTAAEIEHRYDHSRHPNAIVEAQESPGDGMRPGERQVSPTRKGIRRDHVARYEFAARTLPPGSRVLDLACGVGYGSRILAEAGHTVIGLDVDANAIAYARQHYAHERARFGEFDASQGSIEQFGAQDAAVCFETIEHIEDPRPMLKQFAQTCARLIASVPNESVFPWRGHAYHFRHYTQVQFLALLAECGWHVTGWHGQAGTESEPVPDQNGRTLIATCERSVASERFVPMLVKAAAQ